MGSATLDYATLGGLGAEPSGGTVKDDCPVGMCKTSSIG